MELFDKKFVHFMWDDELEGKKCFVSNDIECLHDYVNNEPSATDLIKHSDDEAQPFEITEGIRFRFAYYDPNYEVKKAFNEGKKVQMKVDGFWAICDKPDFEDGEEYRVKLEEEKRYRPYESSAEMIADFIDRFKVNCPSYCEPLIWLKNKQTDARFLITGIESSPYDGENVEVQCGIHCVSGLFDTYTYLDGSPVGMEVKE